MKTALIFAGMLGAASLAWAQHQENPTTEPGPSEPSNTQGSVSSKSTEGTEHPAPQSGSSPPPASSEVQGMNSGTSTGATGKMSHKAFLRECMQMGHDANNGMSTHDMQKACHSQLKQYESGAIEEPRAPQPASSSH